MTDFKTSIDPGNQPKDWLIIQQTEKVRADKQNEEQEAKKNPAAFLLAAFCAYVRKTALFLASRPLIGSKSALAGEIEHELADLKKILLILTVENESRNADYIERLSQTWHALLESIKLIDFFERKKSDVIAQLKILIGTFHSYPPKQEHSLGYYMTEFAGKEWLPFPFMELLDQLYDDFQTRQTESQLSKWVSAIDLILANSNK